MPTNEYSPRFDLGPLEPLLAQGALLLTPNQRLARAIKSAWDSRQLEQGATAWQPARVQALEFWLDSLWRAALDAGGCARRHRLGRIEELEIWQRAIEADCARHGNYALLQTGGAAEIAARARAVLADARIDTNAAAVSAEFNLDADCATFLRWLQAFNAELERQASATAADCYAALLQAEVTAKPVPPAVVLVDFTSISPLQQACIDKFAASATAVSSLHNAAELAARSFPDRSSELAAVARWAAQLQRAQPASRVGIILQDMQADRALLEYQLRREFDCFGENYTALPVNFSTAINLDQAPVVRDALRILATGEREMPLADILGLLRSRYSFPELAETPALGALVKRLFDDGLETVASGRLRFHARASGRPGDDAEPLLWQRLSATQALRLHSGHKLPSAWADCFHDFLGLWGWPGSGALDSLEYQQVERWYRLLEDFAALDRVIGELDFSRALALLRRCSQASLSQPQTPDSPIQVLGPLEAAGLQFDALWICGLEASQWPERPRPNPFIPQRLQRERNLPHATSEQQWCYAESLWRQYRASCSALTASFARQLDNAPQLASPLLDGLPLVDEQAHDTLPPDWLDAFQGAAIEFVEDVAAGEYSGPRQPLPGGSGVLRDQAACPFRAFTRHRLRLEPLGERYNGLSPRDRGKLLHAALQALWEQLGDSRALANADAGALAKVVGAAVQAALDSISESQRLHVGLHCLSLEGQRLEQLLLAWLEVERSRGEFRVEASETPCEFTLGGTTLRLRVDRVDLLADGSRVVFDYKSGRCNVSDWSGERPREPQLPLYSIATGAAAIAFAQVRARDCKIAGVGAVEGVPGISQDAGKLAGNDNPEFGWSDLTGQWHTRLEQLLEEFLAGAAPVDPQPRACDFCGLQPLCRIAVEPEELA
ncbi:PD-(D/E)XK nuclease family protein [Haliea sp. E17]|uniref:PD-(D/E)XK nuclease family protein n=1 Tax=Haliea sp. E17 TaxID=3401576 RepID=UPI003AAEC9E3